MADRPAGRRRRARGPRRPKGRPTEEGDRLGHGCGCGGADRRRAASGAPAVSPNAPQRAAAITCSASSDPRTPSGRSSSWPITTPPIRPSSSTRRSRETVGETAPWVFEQNDTSPPLMWPTVAGPALVAAGAVLGSRRLTGLGTVDLGRHRGVHGAHRIRRGRARRQRQRHRLRRPARDRTRSRRAPAGEHARPLPLHLRGGALRGDGAVHGAPRRGAPDRQHLLPLSGHARLAAPARAARRGDAEDARVPTPRRSRYSTRRPRSSESSSGPTCVSGTRATRSSRWPRATSAPRSAPATSGRTPPTITGRRTLRTTSTTGHSPMRFASAKR